nr:DUF21 domain-containing protein At4g33700-like [Tanacetum cinerariifolium]
MEKLNNIFFTLMDRGPERILTYMIRFFSLSWRIGLESSTNYGNTVHGNKMIKAKMITKSPVIISKNIFNACRFINKIRLIFSREQIKENVSEGKTQVPENLALYDILNEFQKGHSHMAVVVRQCYKTTLEQAATNSPIYIGYYMFVSLHPFLAEEQMAYTLTIPGITLPKIKGFCPNSNIQ